MQTALPFAMQSEFSRVLAAQMVICFFLIDEYAFPSFPNVLFSLPSALCNEILVIIMSQYLALFLWFFDEIFLLFY